MISFRLFDRRVVGISWYSMVQHGVARDDHMWQCVATWDTVCNVLQGPMGEATSHLSQDSIRESCPKNTGTRWNKLKSSFNILNLETS